MQIRVGTPGYSSWILKGCKFAPFVFRYRPSQYRNQSRYESGFTHEKNRKVRNVDWNLWKWN
jgi:hypothetical protein